MKFEKTGSRGSAYTYPAGVLDRLTFGDKLHFQFKKFINPQVRPSDPQISGEKRINLRWDYHVGAKNVEFFRFNNDFEIIVKDLETPPTDEQIDDLVQVSHKQLQTSFDEKRVEYAIFDPIPDITEEEIADNIHRLKTFMIDLRRAGQLELE